MCKGENIMTNIQVTYAAQTITSIEVAEMVGREHKNVMQDIRKISSDLGVLKIQHTLYFKETTYIHQQNNQKYPMFHLTKQGCELYGNRMSGIEGTAFAVAYIERFNEMEAAEQTALPADPIALALQAALDTRQEVQDIKQDVQELKDSMRINTHQEKQLQDMAKQRVLKALGGYNSPAYKAMSKKVFPTVWRDFKNKFDLPTYRALQAKQFEEAKFFLSIWEPSSSMRYDIAVHNRQLQLEVFGRGSK